MTSQPTEAIGQRDDERFHDKCLLHRPAEIRGHLQRLLDTRSVLVGRAEGTGSTQVTALLHVGEVSLLIDVPRSKDILREWLDSPRLHFEASIERISAGFASGPMWLDQHAGRPALGVPFPARLLYRQRREHLRLAPPTGGLRCRVPRHRPEQEPVWHEATIRDIGGGGLAVLAPASALPLQAGEVLEGCVIELPQSGPVTVDLLVRHVVARNGPGPQVLQAGCEFVDLQRGVQDHLLRYVMQLDRERMSRLRALE